MRYEGGGGGGGAGGCAGLPAGDAADAAGCWPAPRLPPLGRLLSFFSATPALDDEDEAGADDDDPTAAAPFITAGSGRGLRQALLLWC